MADATCVIWTGAKNQDGYGRRWDKKRKKVDAVHRMAWREANGEIPKGMLVLHKCDTPACYNPDHLFLGTQHDNMRDCASKGRAANHNTYKTHCLRGHAFDEVNTNYRPDGRRRCRQCAREDAKRRARKKVAA